MPYIAMLYQSIGELNSIAYLIYYAYDFILNLLNANNIFTTKYFYYENHQNTKTKMPCRFDLLKFNH